MSIAMSCDPKPEPAYKSDIERISDSCQKTKSYMLEENGKIEKRISYIEDQLFMITTKKPFSVGDKVKTPCDLEVEVVGYLSTPYREFHSSTILRYLMVTCRPYGKDEVFSIREDKLKI